MAFRKQLIELLSNEFRSASSLARELGMTRGDVEDDLRHALRSARAAGHDIEVVPAGCKPAAKARPLSGVQRLALVGADDPHPPRRKQLTGCVPSTHSPSDVRKPPRSAGLTPPVRSPRIPSFQFRGGADSRFAGYRYSWLSLPRRHALD